MKLPALPGKNNISGIFAPPPAHNHFASNPLQTKGFTSKRHFKNFHSVRRTLCTVISCLFQTQSTRRNAESFQARGRILFPAIRIIKIRGQVFPLSEGSKNSPEPLEGLTSSWRFASDIKTSTLYTSIHQQINFKSHKL